MARGYTHLARRMYAVRRRAGLVLVARDGGIRRARARAGLANDDGPIGPRTRSSRAAASSRRPASSPAWGTTRPAGRSRRRPLRPDPVRGARAATTYASSAWPAQALQAAGRTGPRRSARYRRCVKRARRPVGRVVQVLPMPGLSGGIAMAPDGRTAYVSGTPSPRTGPADARRHAGQGGRRDPRASATTRRTGRPAGRARSRSRPRPTPVPQNFPPTETTPEVVAARPRRLAATARRCSPPSTSPTTRR